jgi:soluble lytic murein transglycosylase-like protein
MGAQGLMQVMPRYHQDKLPEGADELSFFDPILNVRVGARILRESIRRNGGLTAGLQQFAGAPDDAEQRYAAKVLAEKARLEAAAQRGRLREA